MVRRRGKSWEHTGNSTTGAAPAEVVDQCGVAFNDTVHVEIAAEAGIGDFFVFQGPNGGLDSGGRSTTSLEELHPDPGSPGLGQSRFPARQ